MLHCIQFCLSRLEWEILLWGLKKWAAMLWESLREDHMAKQCEYPWGTERDPLLTISKKRKQRPQSCHWEKQPHELVRKPQVQKNKQTNKQTWLIQIAAVEIQGRGPRLVTFRFLMQRNCEWMNSSCLILFCGNLFYSNRKQIQWMSLKLVRFCTVYPTCAPMCLYYRVWSFCISLCSWPQWWLWGWPLYIYLSDW